MYELRWPFTKSNLFTCTHTHTHTYWAFRYGCIKYNKRSISSNPLQQRGEKSSVAEYRHDSKLFICGLPIREVCMCPSLCLSASIRVSFCDYVLLWPQTHFLGYIDKVKRLSIVLPCLSIYIIVLMCACECACAIVYLSVEHLFVDR